MLKIICPIVTVSLIAFSNYTGYAQTDSAKSVILETPEKVGSSIGIFGCDAPGSKQKIGAAAGAVVGGVVGNKVIKGKRVLGTVIGGAAGAAAGSWLGCKLQMNDQKKAQKAAEKAAAEDKEQQWSNAQSGASGRASVVQNASLSGIRFPQNVTPYSRYDNRAGTFAANIRVNLRAAPTTSSEILGSLTSGEAVQVVAGASDTPWLLVAENGVARGYVSAPLVTRLSGSIASGCKLIRQEIDTPSDGKSVQDLQACPDGNGGWAIG